MSGETCTGGTILSVTLAPEAQAGAEEDAGRARKACGVETASRGARMRCRRRAAPGLASPGGRRGNGVRPLGVRVTSLGTQSSGRAARDRLRVRDSGFKVGLGCGRGCCFCGCTAPAASPRPPLRPLTLSVWAERKSRPAHRCSKRLRSESRAYKMHRRVRSVLRGPSGPGGASRKTKKKEGGALRAQRASSNVFSNFEQTQIQEFKECSQASSHDPRLFTGLHTDGPEPRWFH
ncbi:PREDICTED: myosin light chain 5 isoform X4 [Hipposideros armiger]|uniref:Myosin light chain 5 isoform X4 n=1 Tax=Hipposideros armiger TaxID=186990 RepID=A0A8B7SLU6_HIPAR|nr:PREDICTED: myosin light chain 5 isoform X4 [Hipposideros armiger]